MTDKLRELSERLVHKEWYVLGQPWCGYTDTFTILAGSPDPHVAEPILETLPIEDADEDEDHYRQEALAEWLQYCDPNMVIGLCDQLAAAEARVKELKGLVKDPNAVLFNMLRGELARIHPGSLYKIYTREELEYALKEGPNDY